MENQCLEWISKEVSRLQVTAPYRTLTISIHLLPHWKMTVEKTVTEFFPYYYCFVSIKALLCLVNKTGQTFDLNPNRYDLMTEFSI